MSCPIHKIIKSQTFSTEECEQFVRQKEELRICSDCAYALERIINARISAAVSDGNARQNKTAPLGTTVPLRKHKPR